MLCLSTFVSRAVSSPASSWSLQSPCQGSDPSDTHWCSSWSCDNGRQRTHQSTWPAFRPETRPTNRVHNYNNEHWRFLVEVCSWIRGRSPSQHRPTTFDILCSAQFQTWCSLSLRIRFQEQFVIENTISWFSMAGAFHSKTSRTV